MTSYNIWFTPRLMFRRASMVQCWKYWNQQFHWSVKSVVKMLDISQFENHNRVRISYNCMQFQISTLVPILCTGSKNPELNSLEASKVDLYYYWTRQKFRQKSTSCKDVWFNLFWLCSFWNVDWLATTVYNDDRVRFIWKWLCYFE